MRREADRCGDRGGPRGRERRLSLLALRVRAVAVEEERGGAVVAGRLRRGFVAAEPRPHHTGLRGVRLRRQGGVTRAASPRRRRRGAHRPARHRPRRLSRARGFLANFAEMTDVFEDSSRGRARSRSSGDRLLVTTRVTGRGKGSGVAIEAQDLPRLDLRDGMAARLEIFSERGRRPRAALTRLGRRRLRDSAERFDVRVRQRRARRRGRSAPRTAQAAEPVCRIGCRDADGAGLRSQRLEVADVALVELAVEGLLLQQALAGVRRRPRPARSRRSRAATPGRPLPRPRRHARAPRPTSRASSSSGRRRRPRAPASAHIFGPIAATAIRGRPAAPRASRRALRARRRAAAS